MTASASSVFKQLVMPAGLERVSVEETLADTQRRINALPQWAKEVMSPVQMAELSVFMGSAYTTVTSVTEYAIFGGDHLILSPYVSHSATPLPKSMY